MMWTWGGEWWWGMGLGMILWIALTILVVWLVVRALVGTGRIGDRTPDSVDPERILRERFARGEIDEEEYRERLSVIRAE